MRFIVFLTALLFAVTTFAQEVVTNDTVIRMMQANVPPATIIRTIEASPNTAFRLGPDDLQALATARVPEDVIRAMAQKSSGRVLAAPRQSSANASSEPSAWRYEIRGLVGSNAGPNRGEWELPKTGLSGGLEFGVKIKGPWSAIGRYVFNGMGEGKAVVCAVGSPCYLVPFKSRIQETVGGIKLAKPGKVSPYVQFAAGLAHGSASTSGRVGYTTIGASVSANRFAIVPGGGLDVEIGSHAGVGFDIAYMKLKDAGWLARGAVAVFFRF